MGIATGDSCIACLRVIESYSTETSRPTIHRETPILIGLSKLQHLTLINNKLHLPFLGPLPQLIKTLLQFLITFLTVHDNAYFSIIRKFNNHALYILIQIIDVDNKQQQAQHQPLRHTTSHGPPVQQASFHSSSLLPTIKPIVYPICQLSLASMRSNLPEQPITRNLIKGLTEIHTDYIYRPALINL
eukprot:g27287.t1